MKIYKYVITLAVTAMILVAPGCSFSSFRCGTDGESSYVDWRRIDDVNSSSTALAQLCGFDLEKESTDG